MEVASPLPFQSAGSKRSYMCSPPAMDVSDDYVQAKRRRFGESSSPLLASSFNSSPFANATNAARMGGGKLRVIVHEAPRWIKARGTGLKSTFHSSSFADKNITMTSCWCVFPSILRGHASTVHTGIPCFSPADGPQLNHPPLLMLPLHASWHFLSCCYRLQQEKSNWEWGKRRCSIRTASSRNCFPQTGKLKTARNDPPSQNGAR